MDVESEDQGREQRLLKRGIRYRGGVEPLQKSACFNLSLSVSPLAGKDWGWRG